MALKKTRLSCILILLLTALVPTGAWTKDSISWMEAVAPPFFIHEGKFKGQGYEDLITDILIKNLPAYEHTHVIANISRHYQQWKQGEKACALAMYKTPERMEFAYFSIPSVITLPTVLIINKEKFNIFGGSKTVSLTDILKSHKYIVGRSKNRSYGIEFDTTLNTYGDSRNIFVYEGPELTLNLFKMLLAGRIDALSGLPEEAMYLAETMGIRDRIMTLNITENQVNNDASLTYVACSKNEWGKKTINDINAVLREQRPTESYRAAYERWLDPSSITGYQKLYREAFITVTE
ncbi:TIGR02285 family protein [Desulfopila sp. IMCC35006]|uniref:TIGR02285 family protein n=1 Tax=Desulfopila sp. IMCC35006 TaxID=2569542 RepID=UPI0010AC207B|nr:TIGR02285 family protein [Desulfopila sp. IMCC35006]TKB24147.1 TIGR02285 family protein [Desulfopila sp. IMCC35006]